MEEELADVPEFLGKLPKPPSLRSVGFDELVSKKETSRGPFKNDVRREGEGGGCPNSDAVREVA